MARPGVLHTKKTWEELLSDCKTEFRLWGITEYELPKFRQAANDGYVVVKFKVNDQWSTPTCDTFKDNTNGTQANFLAIIGQIRAARLADQRGIGPVLAEVTRHLALSASTEESPYEVLGVVPGLPQDSIKRIYRSRLFEADPNHGGSSDELKRIVDAGKALGVG